MNILISASFLLLGIVIVAEWLALIEIMQETLILKRVLMPQARDSRTGRMLGNKVPEFQLGLLGSSTVVTQNDLKDRTTALVFLEPHILSGGTRDFAGAVLQAISRQFRDNELWIVCCGDLSACRELENQRRFGCDAPVNTKLVHDANNHLKSALAVVATPASVVVAPDGTVSRIGEIMHMELIGAADSRVGATP